MITKKFNSGGFIIDSSNPVIYKIKFFPEDEGDTLTIYDNDVGAESGDEIAYLDADNPIFDFGEKGQRCHKGVFAYLPSDGSYYVTWDD